MEYCRHAVAVPLTGQERDVVTSGPTGTIRRARAKIVAIDKKSQTETAKVSHFKNMPFRWQGMTVSRDIGIRCRGSFIDFGRNGRAAQHRCEDEARNPFRLHIGNPPSLESRRKLDFLSIFGAWELVHSGKQNGRIRKNQRRVFAKYNLSRRIRCNHLKIGVNVLGLGYELGAYGAEKDCTWREPLI
jgi:hypothetical protein